MRKICDVLELSDCSGDTNKSGTTDAIYQVRR